MSADEAKYRRRIYCSVFGCLKNNAQNPELSYFCIPKDPESQSHNRGPCTSGVYMEGGSAAPDAATVEEPGTTDYGVAVMEEAEYIKEEAEYIKDEAEYIKQDAEYIKEEVEYIKDEAEYIKEEAEYIKEEQDSESDTSIYGVSAAAARAGLYARHEVKDELVLGPEELQRSGAAFFTPNDTLNASPPSIGRQPPAPSVVLPATHSSAVVKKNTVHTREKPHSCDVCKKSFRVPCQLKDHKLSHTGERPYSCDVCKKSFTLARVLRAHERIHTGERPYSCDVCKKSFIIARALKEHELRHTGERPYSCDVCKKSFTVARSLRVHERIHTGERPYSCDVCKKSYTVARLLKIHERVHTGERPDTLFVPCM